MKATNKHTQLTNILGIELLPEPHKTIYKMRYEDKLSQKEIAEEIGYKEGYIRVSIHRSNAKLKNSIRY